MYKPIDFLGIKISAITKDEIVDKILEFALVGKHKMITYLNAHCVNVSFADFEYREILQAADLVYAGGKGVVWSSRLFDKSLPERVNILDFFDRLVERIIEKKLKIYLLGGKPDVAQIAADELKKRFPALEISGFHHGFFNGREESDIIEEVNFLKPNILMVGLGIPKQEQWIYRHLNELDVNLCWGVGAAFDWLSGQRKRAPGWMINCGLEWLHRLYQEPKRLWKRYLIGNPVFIYRVLKQRMWNL
ncbi:MAG: WecB/TagA/CpsF family glycosyltransferase [Candidatus Omnitrophica bacterium]|nr:WecB/TagA/CpsF family glycosyltransferase [Candidatus Omnitrophota bacterium]